MSEASNRLRVIEERALVICLEAITDGETCYQDMLDMLPAWTTTHEGTLSENGRILAQAIADRNELRFLCRDYEQVLQAAADMHETLKLKQAQKLLKRRV